MHTQASLRKDAISLDRAIHLISRVDQPVSGPSSMRSRRLILFTMSDEHNALLQISQRVGMLELLVLFFQGYRILSGQKSSPKGT